jgi:PAS domain S-box-containing protein
LVPLAIALLVLLGLLLGSSYEQLLRQRNEEVERTAWELQQHVERETERSVATMQSLLAALVQNERLQAAFLGGDRELLLREARPLFETMRSQNQISHFYFHRLDHVNFLRVHRAQEHDDTIKRLTLRQADQSDRLTFGNEQGPFGNYTLRCVMPWRVRGERLGFLELGVEYEDIVDVARRMMRHAEQTRFAIAVSKEDLTREKWESTAKTYGKPNTWDEFPSVVLIASSFERLPPFVRAQLSPGAGARSSPPRMIQSEGSVLVHFSVPLRNAQGKETGHLFVARDVTALIRAQNLRVILDAVSFIAMSLAILAAFYLFLGKVQGQLDEKERLSVEIAERRQAEQALRRREEETRQIVESAYDAFVSMDAQGRILWWNSQAARLFGYAREEALGKTVSDLIVPPAYREAHEQGLRRFLKTGEGPVLNKRIEISALRRDGKEFPIALAVWPVRTGQTYIFNAFIHDISARKQMEMELRQAQKLESVGQLAAGIAHEINTPIQFVGDNARFLKDGFKELEALLGEYRSLRRDVENGRAPRDTAARILELEQDLDVDYLSEEIPRAIGQTLDGVERVATIVRAMKDFAHPNGKEQAAADLNQALQSTLTVARNELKYVAEVETDFGQIPPVVCHVGDMNQVFLNILVNAAHAIADVVGRTDRKGKITVKTAQENDAVLITISDTGPGIPEAIRSRIFDPFFTTKEVGKGTGQGLTIARSIVVEKHGGSLNFESEVGRGTTFSIRLPIRGTTAASSRTSDLQDATPGP